MTILLTIWRLITGNRIARTVGMIVMAVLGVLTFGAVKKREGAKAARSEAAVKAAKGYQKTTERMQNEDAAMGDDPAALREWLRKRDADKR